MLCLNFSPSNAFIGCTSDTGTIHIFSIANISKKLNEKSEKEETNNEIKPEEKNEDNEPKNRKSLLGKIGGLFNITEHDRSFAKFRIKEEYGLLCFGKHNTIVVITKEGKHIEAAYNPTNGICSIIDEKNFFEQES